MHAFDYKKAHSEKETLGGYTGKHGKIPFAEVRFLAGASAQLRNKATAETSRSLALARIASPITPPT
jgi:hypothetical protein